MSISETESPSLSRYVLGFLCVGIAWGFTTPFIRQAALQKQAQKPPGEQRDGDTAATKSWTAGKIQNAWATVLDLVTRPAYTVPLLINLSGSALFFMIVGQAELSLTVPITNSLAFLFTVLGEWIAEGKSITKDTWIGMVLVLAGIAICVHAKTDVS